MIRVLRFIGIGLALLVCGGAIFVAVLLDDVPSLERWQDIELAPADAPPGPGEVQVTFLGVSTLVIRDARTTLLVDGFFTRPGLFAMLFGEIAPDPDVIARELSRAGVSEASAVLVVHSHFDHAMDAPEAARQTGAVVVGSASTANVCRGWGLPEEQIVVPALGEPLRFGDFTVRLLPSEHFPHGMAMGEIGDPLVPPARALDYLDGGSFSIFVEHESAGTILVHASAGWKKGKLSGQRADVVLLGVGMLGSSEAAFRQTYYDEVVSAVGARLVVPIHWDDFTRPLTEPLVPIPRVRDDLDVTMDYLAERAAEPGGARLALLPPLRPVTLLPLSP